jgi:hypothetical protein
VNVAGRIILASLVLPIMLALAAHALGSSRVPTIPPVELRSWTDDFFKERGATHSEGEVIPYCFVPLQGRYAPCRYIQWEGDV